MTHAGTTGGICAAVPQDARSPLVHHRAHEVPAAPVLRSQLDPATEDGGRRRWFDIIYRHDTPPSRNFDLALVLAILVQLVLMVLVILIAGANPAAVGLQLLVWAIIAVTSLFLKIFFFAMIISVILSWVAPGSYNPGAQLVNQICEPLLAPFRRLLPNLGGLDISPIFAFIALNLLDRFVIGNLAMMSGMPAILSPFI